MARARRELCRNPELEATDPERKRAKKRRESGYYRAEYLRRKERNLARAAANEEGRNRPEGGQGAAKNAVDGPADGEARTSGNENFNEVKK